VAQEVDNAAFMADSRCKGDTQMSLPEPEGPQEANKALAREFLVEHWSARDDLSLLQRLGVVTLPG
jgi:hypothetical protein